MISSRRVFGAVTLMLMTGCSSVSPAAEPPPLDGTGWVVEQPDGRPADHGAAVTARFEEGRVSGSDGCNRYSAPYVVRGATIEIGPRGISTQMACPPEVMQRADAFMAALTGARSYRVVGGRLELLDGGGGVLVTMAAESQSLAGTSWHATGINNGREAVVSVATGSEVTMTFGADGTVTGSGGCNRFTATYTSNGSALSFTPAAATRRMCAEAGVMEQEQAFFKALETVSTMRIEGDRLEMRSADGALAVTLARDAGP